MKRFISFVFLAVAMPFVLSCTTPEIRTVAILGDSYSTFAGYIPEGYACWYSQTPQGENDVTMVEQTWWHQFCSANGYELVLNNSYSGSTVCNTGYDAVDYSDRSFITRMKDCVEGDEIPDMILIFGGTNDSWANSPIGEMKYENWTQEDLYDFLPAYCNMLDYLTKAAPDAVIVNIINSELKDEVTNGIMEASAHYGTRCLLLHDIEKLWGHPSVKGMSAISDQLTSFLQSSAIH